MIVRFTGWSYNSVRPVRLPLKWFEHLHHDLSTIERKSVYILKTVSMNIFFTFQLIFSGNVYITLRCRICKSLPSGPRAVDEGSLGMMMMRKRWHPKTMEMSHRPCNLQPPGALMVSAFLEAIGPAADGRLGLDNPGRYDSQR